MKIFAGNFLPSEDMKLLKGAVSQRDTKLEMNVWTLGLLQETCHVHKYPAAFEVPTATGQNQIYSK